VRLIDLTRSQLLLLLFDEGRLPGCDPGRIKQLFHNIDDLKVILIVPPKVPSTGINGEFLLSKKQMYHPSWKF